MGSSFSPMRLRRIPEPFDNPHWLFEPKLDGFRALAHVTGQQCQLVSRNGHVFKFKSWPRLGEEIAHSLRTDAAVLDGEIVCLDPDGRSNFKNLLFRRQVPYYCAFDVVTIDDTDLRDLPLYKRKRRLQRILGKAPGRVLLMQHIEARGIDLFRAACERDLEGIVAKWRHGCYISNGRTTSWFKIKNPAYSQMEGRRELFESRGS